MKRFKRHLCDHLFLRTGGYLDRHGDKPGLARTGVRRRTYHVDMDVDRYIYSSITFSFFKFFLTAQGRIAQGAPILAEIRASSKAVRQQNNDELEQRTRWNEEPRAASITIYNIKRVAGASRKIRPCAHLRAHIRAFMPLHTSYGRLMNGICTRSHVTE